jgi:hypothetical protein
MDFERPEKRVRVQPGICHFFPKLAVIPGQISKRSIVGLDSSSAKDGERWLEELIRRFVQGRSHLQRLPEPRNAVGLHPPERRQGYFRRCRKLTAGKPGSLPGCSYSVADLVAHRSGTVAFCRAGRKDSTVSLVAAGRSGGESSAGGMAAGDLTPICVRWAAAVGREDARSQQSRDADSW